MKTDHACQAREHSPLLLSPASISGDEGSPHPPHDLLQSLKRRDWHDFCAHETREHPSCLSGHISRMNADASLDWEIKGRTEVLGLWRRLHTTLSQCVRESRAESEGSQRERSISRANNSKFQRHTNKLDGSAALFLSGRTKPLPQPPPPPSSLLAIGSQEWLTGR